MKQPGNNWYVVTGGPSVGKSTLLDELAKLGHKTFPEAARVVIDEAIAEGKTVLDIRSDEHKFQMDVLARKVKTELEHSRELLTFFDRGMHDTLAYLRLHGFAIGDQVTKAMRDASYRNIFLLDPLDRYDVDYARTETRAEALKLNKLLASAYEEYGMKPTVVPVLSPKERAKFVLDHIRQEPAV